MYEDCEQCEWDEPHYHCSNCKAVTGMMGHFNFELSEFTCERKEMTKGTPQRSV